MTDTKLLELVDLAYTAFSGSINSPKWQELSSREKEAWIAAISSVKMKLEMDMAYLSKKGKK